MGAKLIAEFIGTYLLIFTVGCNVLSGTPVWGGVSIACVLMVSIFCFGGVSGANFNPAVSVALGINKNLEWSDVGAYSVVQLIAGITAGFSYSALFGKSFALGPGKGFGIVEACIAEILYTFMLCFVVLNVAALKKKNNDHAKTWYGLAIGFVIVAGAYGAGAVSGGCFNPAVATGIGVSGSSFTHILPYFVSELIGAGIAAGLFKVVRPDPENTSYEQDDVEPTLPSKLVAEFIGTYFLILTVGLNVLGKSPAGAFSIAASLMCMICALGDVSGANFNPAVSLALIINGALEPATAGAYMGVQVVAGCLAAVTYSAIYGGKSFPLGPGAGYGLGQAAVAEIVYTFVLCLVVLAVAVHPKTKSDNFFPLAIGSCVTVGGNAIGAISGGSLNPAVSFGLASVSGSLVNAVAYSVFEFIGAGLAAGVVMASHAEAKEDDAAAKEP